MTYSVLHHHEYVTHDRWSYRVGQDEGKQRTAEKHTPVLAAHPTTGLFCFLELLVNVLFLLNR